MTEIIEIPPKNENERYTYEASDINWKNYKSSIPIIVREDRDIEKVKRYIESKIYEYETTASNIKLCIV